VQQCENHLCDNCVDLFRASMQQSPPITLTSGQGK
jgi:hypothetical protein